ncbi:MAG: HAMP domain-containing histidine kinase [Eubacterium sp.]|nr:HAMP domain-containing histidine kinase [Eubacterium sp.]MCM1216669.1 HAMP domain-containing histidine kinase [Lachnospiraceae bacterium]MCM1303143.1 HAMP domain-containing histidine kinase [Butyrivibrio sp.]MCM1345199.1 HAMP domain-containing histidine kinase [Muribaculaceae bacterium]MCM1240407.1 HAMP domain-containing histidine kinase [Lachnospiraceae bacterium]
MKFLYKILLWTIIIMAAAFGFSGYFFVNYVFETALDREIEQAMSDSNILQFAFETAALNIPTKYDVLQDIAVEQIGSKLESGGQGTGRLLRLSDEEKKMLYASEGFPEDAGLIQQVEESTGAYQVVEQDDHYYIQTGIMVNVLDRHLYLETMEDVTEVFAERTMGFSVYRRVTLVMLAVCAVVMYVICFWLTKPIRLLAGATRKMAEGDYSYRAQIISNDELGALTADFNSMANVLEETIGELQDEIRAREDFIAAFAHELKTPLTAIIGYADLLRSRKLDEEKHFLSSNYIYTEGKRLENMSFRLLDIIVTKRDQIETQPIAAASLFQYLQDMFDGNTEQQIDIMFEPATVYGEINLIKSVLLNLVDNACKASSQGGVVEVDGACREEGYLFQVKDYGVGIPEEELKKVTEAFYMVDKSRSRSKNGAGLGLALCVEILRLHNSVLNIESKLGEGTCISFYLSLDPDQAGGTHED